MNSINNYHRTLFYLGSPPCALPTNEANLSRKIISQGSLLDDLDHVLDVE